MANVIRKTYPAAFSTGLLFLIFAVVFLLSQQIFNVPISALKDNTSVYFGMFLVATAVIIMVLILWEELLFPIKIKNVEGGVIFRNHRNKILTQLLIYISIPVIFCFIYLEYEVNHVRFFIWAGICILLPVLEKISSGLKNYNDFLKLTKDEIEFRDNDHVGRFATKDLQTITIITHDKDITHQIQLVSKNNETTTIDLHDMELEAFYVSIQLHMSSYYGHMLKEIKVD